MKTLSRYLSPLLQLYIRHQRAELTEDQAPTPEWRAMFRCEQIGKAEIDQTARKGIGAGNWAFVILPLVPGDHLHWSELCEKMPLFTLSRRRRFRP
jgi:hypothetical protein